MNQLRPLTLSAAMAIAIAASAYDFRADNGDCAVFYNITGENTVEVTCSGESSLHGCYYGKVSVPDAVEHSGRRYTVTAIGDRAFANCTELEGVLLPETVNAIGRRAFLGCRAIEAISLPRSLQRIDASAFAWCDALTEISLPASVTFVAPTAFDGCTALTSVNADAGGAYSSLDGVLTDRTGTTVVIYPPGRTGSCGIPVQVTAVGDKAFYGSGVSRLTLPATLTSIGERAFYFSNNLTEVSIPASVQHIGDGAFADCFSLAVIDVEQSNPVYTSEEGMLCNKDVTVLLQCPAGMYDLPDLPSTVREIAPQAFFRCYGISAIEIPDGTEAIGDAAFIDCPGAVSLHIPATVRGIGHMAFAQCSGLRHVYLDATDPHSIATGDEIFANVPLDQCTLYVPLEALETYRFTKPWSDFAVIEGYKKLKPQTITWDQSLKPETGDHAILHASASSGLPVSYTVSALSEGFARIEYDKVYFLDPGNIVITATQPGSHEYLPASPVVQRVYVKGTEGVEDIDETLNIRVTGLHGRITVSGAPENAVVNVYGITGQCLYSGRKTVIDMPSGQIYIVRVAARAFKIAL